MVRVGASTIQLMELKQTNNNDDVLEEDGGTKKINIYKD